MTQPLYRPPAHTLRTGDLVWVKRDDQIVFFADRTPFALSSTAVEQGAAQALQSKAWSAAQRAHIEQWQPEPMHADIWVGHVGMVQLRGGQPWVVDATPDRHQPTMPGLPAPANPHGVAAQSYAAWLADSDHAQSHVWHGRVNALSPMQAHAALDYAVQQLGKPYRFLPWGFASEQSFYCSELVWCAVRHASGIVLDDEPSTLRVDWFTPCLAINSPHIQVLFAPPDRRYCKLG